MLLESILDRSSLIPALLSKNEVRYERWESALSIPTSHFSPPVWRLGLAKAGMAYSRARYFVPIRRIEQLT